MPTEKLKIHLIGIGGIGISALARYYLAQGHQVSGSDLVSSEITQALKKKGVRFGSIGYRQTDLVVYSPAVPENNPELKKARESGIKCLSYPQALGELTKKYFTIAVSGTHGKSTTCAMIGIILAKAGLDPTVIVGTKVKEFEDSNCRMGKSKYLVIEADECFGSFLNYWPKIIVLTNIEKDHLDYYKNFKNLTRTFQKYIGHLPKDGTLIMNKSLAKTILPSGKNVLYFYLGQKESKKLKKNLQVPGKHNVANALAALAAARALKISDKISFKALSEFRGCWRRFEIIRRNPIIVSDYAHHPTEIKTTLKAAREKWPKKEIWCVFQPHQYQRTYYLFNDFVKVLRQAPVDKIIITDIYDVAGREEKKIKKNVSAEKLAKAVKNPKVSYLAKDQIINYLKKNLGGREVVITMGAGDIYQLDKDLK